MEIGFTVDFIRLKTEVIAVGFSEEEVYLEAKWSGMCSRLSLVCKSWVHSPFGQAREKGQFPLSSHLQPAGDESHKP